jgi:Uma2 family endonuclease
MNESYAETLGGTPLVRRAPGGRHEAICAELHRCVLASVANLTSTRLLPPRAAVRLSHNTVVCPDLSLVAAATGKLWLAAEIVSTEDHATDRVVKKQLYEDLRLPRLWMIDPRYDNVEVYHATPYGLALFRILAGQEILSEKLLPEFQLSITDLFQVKGP